MWWLRRLATALVIAICVLASPPAAMLLAVAIVEALIGIAATLGGLALAALLGVALILSRHVVAPPSAETPSA